MDELFLTGVDPVAGCVTVFNLTGRRADCGAANRKSLVFFRTQTFCSASSRLHMSGLTFKRNIHDNLSYEDLNYGKIFNDPIHVSNHSMPTGTPH